MLLSTLKQLADILSNLDSLNVAVMPLTGNYNDEIRFKNVNILYLLAREIPTNIVFDQLEEAVSSISHSLTRRLGIVN